MLKRLTETVGLWLLLRGGERIMYATFLANRVIGGHLEYVKVPSSIKEQVAKILKEEGAEHLITDGE